MIAKHIMGPVSCSACDIPHLLVRIKTALSDRLRAGFSVNFMNAHLYNLCWTDAEMRRLINESDVVAADGMSIVWASRLFGFRIPGRCNMTDSFRAFLADRTAPASTAILVGGTQEEAERAARAIEKDGPHVRITEAISGFHTITEYAEWLKPETPPDLVLVGMGSPKSEQFIEAARRLWPGAVVWHIGGGTIMFFAGSLVEAPAWMRRCGLQWLHRLVIEPRRMWRRYVLGNPLFVLRVIEAALRRPQLVGCR